VYETPTLNQVGKAEEVVRGIASLGDDLDTNLWIDNMGFEDDTDNE